MKQFFIFPLLCCIFGNYLQAQAILEPNVVIVKFERAFVERELRPAFADQRVRKAMPKFQSSAVAALNSKHEIVGYEPMFRTDPRYKERHKAFDLDLFYRVTYTSPETHDEICRSFMATDAVLHAEPNYIYEIKKTPNDVEYYRQWGLKNIDKEHIDINVEKAWDITTGHNDVIVAIIDNCVDGNHQDLSANMWYNFEETPNNLQDDDNNGFVDDYRGWNFSDETDYIYPNNDVESHGTHVAGIVAARGNNSRGVAGVAGGWGTTRGIRLMMFRTGYVDPEDNKTYISHGYEAMVYAADNGAAIAQCSWGGTGIASASQAAIDYFTANGGGEVMNGGLVIAAAGNENVSTLHYPAAVEKVLSVGAIDRNGNRSTFSNYGAWVDICAPGTAIYSCLPNNKYGNMQGTSMACPMVSGVAALVLSATRNWPQRSKTPEWLSNHLIETGYRAWTAESQIGPLVDAYNALNEVASANQPEQKTKVEVQVFPNPTSDVVYIRNLGTQPFWSYTVVNLKGETVFFKAAPQSEETLPANQWPKGIYFLRIETEQGIHTEKIIKR